MGDGSRLGKTRKLAGISGTADTAHPGTMPCN